MKIDTKLNIGEIIYVVLNSTIEACKIVKIITSNEIEYHIKSKLNDYNILENKLNKKFSSSSGVSYFDNLQQAIDLMNDNINDSDGWQEFFDFMCGIKK